LNQRPLGPQPPAPTCRAVAELLESKGSDGKAKNGFFLQVEGASIDKRDHAADPCGQIGETLAFDWTVKVALYYKAQHPPPPQAQANSTPDLRCGSPRRARRPPTSWGSPKRQTHSKLLGRH